VFDATPEEPGLPLSARGFELRIDERSGDFVFKSPLESASGIAPQHFQIDATCLARTCEMWQDHAFVLVD
jgi:hypothetical protein